MPCCRDLASALAPLDASSALPSIGAALMAGHAAVALRAGLAGSTPAATNRCKAPLAHDRERQFAASDLKIQASGNVWGTGVTHHPATPTAVQQNIAKTRAEAMASVFFPGNQNPKTFIFSFCSLHRLVNLVVFLFCSLHRLVNLVVILAYLRRPR